jgi:phytol kinase
MKETLRQTVHLIFGVGIAYIILLAEKEAVIALFALSIFAGLIISDAITRGFSLPLISPLILLMEREDAVPAKGALFFTVSALFCLVFFPTTTVFIAVLVLSLLDSLTTLFGRRFGKTQIINRKTLEGSLSGVLVTGGVLLFYLPALTAAVVALVAGIVELLSPVDDNLTIPVSVCLLLSILPPL